MKKVGLIVEGVTDCWIAETLAGKDLDVIVVETAGTDLREHQASIEGILAQKQSKWAITESEKKVILARITYTYELEALADAEIVIESTQEQLSRKQALARRLEQICPASVILASNSALLPISKIAEQAKYPERFIGVHFMRDVVEVISGPATSAVTYETASQFAAKIGKSELSLNESPGSVTIRTLVPLINEAITILSEGLASAEEIDLALKKGAGFKEGPLEMADRFGLDRVQQMMEVLFRESGESKYRPASLLKSLVRSGALGVKAGHGFFTYDQNGKRMVAIEQGA